MNADLDAARNSWRARVDRAARQIVLACTVVLLVVCPAGGEAADPGARLATLGKHLFGSPLLSVDGTVSCRSCHVPALGFSGDRPVAVGVGGYATGRRAPALLGLRHATAVMWDGRASGLAAQVTIPLESPEMGVEWSDTLRRLRDDPIAAKLAATAGQPAPTRQLVLDAIAAYVSSLDGGGTRFDHYYFGRDDTAMTEQEVRGFRLFEHKAGCASCHLVDGGGAPFTDGLFHVTGAGADGPPRDRGRGAVTGRSADEGAFKTPTLRGSAVRPFLMHDGSLTSLRQVVDFYNRGAGRDAGDIDARLRPLFLSSAEVDALVAFLSTLTPPCLDPSPGDAAQH